MDFLYPIDYYSHMSDNELVTEFQNGNEKAFNTLFIRYIPMIVYKVQTYSEIGFEHSDFIQEGLLGLYYAVKTYKTESNASFKTYAYVCISNKLNSVLKSIGRQKNIPINSSVPLETSENSLPYKKNNPEDIVIIDEEISEIKRKIDFVLSENERNVFFLYLEGLSYKQISEKLNIKPKAVDNTLQQLRRKLRS